MQCSAHSCDVLLTGGSHVSGAILFSVSCRASSFRESRARSMRSIVRAVFMTATTTVHRSFSADAHRRSDAMVKLVIIRRATRIGIRTFENGCPCHSPTPHPFAFGPGRAHAREACACAHPGADAGGAAQREREGHPMICARLLL